MTHKILFVHSRPDCESGSPTSLIDIVTHLDRSRYEPVVMTSRQGPLSAALQARRIAVLIQPDTLLTKTSVPRYARHLATNVCLLRTMRPSIVHANRVDWRPSIMLAARMLRIPSIVHVRNDGEYNPRNSTLRWASHIIAVSNHVARPFVADRRFSQKVSVLYNGVDLTQYEFRRRNTYPIPQDHPTIGFVGRISPMKGVHIAIQALKLVREVYPTARLIAIGCAPKEHVSYERYCRQLVSDNGLCKHVRFMGFRDDVHKWMPTFDVFVLPTVKEAFGKVIIEAMAAGCPVVASRVGGIPEIIPDERFGVLVEPNDPREFANGIIRILSDPIWAGEVASRSAARVHEMFSLSAMLSRLQDIYACFACNKPAKIWTSTPS